MAFLPYPMGCFFNSISVPVLCAWLGALSMSSAFAKVVVSVLRRRRNAYPIALAATLSFILLPLTASRLEAQILPGVVSDIVDGSTLDDVVDSLNLPPALTAQLDAVCADVTSAGCQSAVQQLLSAVPPTLTGLLQVPSQLSSALDSACDSLPLSQQCTTLLNQAAISLPSSNQFIASTLASGATFTNQQVTDFALASIAVLPASQTEGTLRSVSPTVATFGISGVARTDHDGFRVQSGAFDGRSVSFEALDAGATLGVRFDASNAVNLPKDFLTIGLFGNYTGTEIDFESTRALRELGFRNTGDASLDSGSGGMYGLLTNGEVYGLLLGSGQFGSADVTDSVLNSRSSFDTSGVATSALVGTVLPMGGAKLDLRGGLNYVDLRADNHTDSAGVRFSEGRIEDFSGTASARLFTNWLYRDTVIRPFLQAGVDYRFDYNNEIEVENVNFHFEEGSTTVFGRAGMDFDIKDRVQAYLALRADHNEDFDTLSGQAGLTFRFN